MQDPTIAEINQSSESGALPKAMQGKFLQLRNTIMASAMPGKPKPDMLPDEWNEHEQDLVNMFFTENVPQWFQNNPHPNGEAPTMTASDCDRTAQLLMSAPVVRSEKQGHSSYTLVCPERNKVIQYRVEELNLELIEKARHIWGDLVPKTQFVKESPLPLYFFDIISGQIHSSLEITRAAFPLEREKRTVIDVAKFIAKAIHFPNAISCIGKDSMEENLYRLMQNASLKRINPEIHAEITRLHSKLHLLETVPAVLTHPAPVPRNIFVDSIGALTGVIGFEDASIQIFGSNIFALYESFFGRLENGVWSLYDMPAGDKYPGKSVYDVLAAAFWEALVAGVAPVLTMEEHHEA
ncbi:hypothetical protein P7C71_g6602, partial [Lecanoromycetidae sp. Uapishka_2]